MQIACLFFASLAEVAGTSRLQLEVADELTVEELVHQLEIRFPRLADYRGRFQIAVGEEFAEPQQVLSPQDEVALLPPVSGGDGDLVRLVDKPIEVGPLLEVVRRADAGAVALFLGTVRDLNAGLPVELLEYSSYRPMAEKKMAELVTQARSRFDLKQVCVVHRVGALAPGEVAVLVAVSSAHRAPAFEASRWLIDTLKETVPLWKREVGPGGAVWIEGDARVPSGEREDSRTQAENLPS